MHQLINKTLEDKAFYAEWSCLFQISYIEKLNASIMCILKEILEITILKENHKSISTKSYMKSVSIFKDSK